VKVCCACEETKPLSEFGSWKKSKDGLQPKCKKCKREYDNNYYGTNQSNRRQQIRKSDSKRREYLQNNLWNILKDAFCTDCGISDPRVLEFDHIRDKERNIADMVKGHSWSTIEKEIAKCEIVCANCHRIRTQVRSGSWRTLMPL
jgi:hypothetical protein